MTEALRINNSGIFFRCADGTFKELKIDPKQTLRPGNVSPTYKLEVKENDRTSR